MSDVVQHPTKTMIVLGARGAGKATLIGNLMYKCGGVDMILLEKMQKAGIHKYDQVFGYCKEHGIKPAFEARHATVLFIEEATSANRPDYMIYMVDAAIKKPPIELLGYDARATSTIIVVNKMDTCDWSEESYNRALLTAISQLDEQGIRLNNHVTIPISALHGDNVIETSTMSPWFTSKSSKHKTLVEAIDIAAGW